MAMQRKWSWKKYKNFLENFKPFIVGNCLIVTLDNFKFLMRASHYKKYARKRKENKNKKCGESSFILLPFPNFFILNYLKSTVML